jgi:hypothetical protein
MSGGLAASALPIHSTLSPKYAYCRDLQFKSGICNTRTQDKFEMTQLSMHISATLLQLWSSECRFLLSEWTPHRKRKYRTHTQSPFVHNWNPGRGKSEKSGPKENLGYGTRSIHRRKPVAWDSTNTCDPFRFLLLSRGRLPVPLFWHRSTLKTREELGLIRS